MREIGEGQFGKVLLMKAKVIVNVTVCICLRYKVIIHTVFVRI